MTITSKQKLAGGIALIIAVAIAVPVILSLRQGSATNLESLVTPVDVSDADLRCYMRRSAVANKEARADVNRARMLWFTDWWSPRGFYWKRPTKSRPWRAKSTCRRA